MLFKEMYKMFFFKLHHLQSSVNICNYNFKFVYT